MEIKVVTMEDLRQLKMELIEEMKETFNLIEKIATSRYDSKVQKSGNCSRYLRVPIRIYASGDYYVIVRSEEAIIITGTISVLLWKGATAMDKFGRTKQYPPRS